MAWHLPNTWLPLTGGYEIAPVFVVKVITVCDCDLNSTWDIIQLVKINYGVAHRKWFLFFYFHRKWFIFYLLDVYFCTLSERELTTTSPLPQTNRKGKKGSEGDLWRWTLWTVLFFPRLQLTHTPVVQLSSSDTHTHIFLSLHDCSLICFITIMWVAFVLLGLEIIQKLLYHVLFFWKEDSVFAWYFEWCAVAGGYDVI